jgi:hypothetical protein
LYYKSTESLLSLLSKVIDAYWTPPLLKPYDRTSKEFRRRSVDATLILGLPGDVLATDPVFVIRRSAINRQANSGTRAPGPVPTLVDELASSQQKRSSLSALATDPVILNLSPTTISSLPYDAPTPLMTGTSTQIVSDTLLSNSTPALTPRETIAAQRSAAQANQRSILSAQKNSAQGVDVVLPNRETIRSSRVFDDDRVRYSYIDEDGSETDISEIVESEWATAPTDDGFVSRASRILTGVSLNGSTLHDRSRSEQEEEREAVDALKETPLTIEGGDHGSFKAIPRSKAVNASTDILEDALGERVVISPGSSESLQERLDRVLAKAKDKRRKSRDGSRTPSRQANKDDERSITPNPTNSTSSNEIGTTSPVSQRTETTMVIEPSPTGTLPDRGSPFPENGRLSPTLTRLAASTSRLPDSPASSIHSGRTVGGGSNETPDTSNSAIIITRGGGRRSSTNRRTSNGREARTIVYHDNYGLETLLTLVEGESSNAIPIKLKAREDSGVEGLFGRDFKDLEIAPEVREMFAESRKTHEDLDSVSRVLRHFCAQKKTYRIPLVCNSGLMSCFAR